MVWYRRDLDCPPRCRQTASCCTSARSTTGPRSGSTAACRRPRGWPHPFSADITDGAASPTDQQAVVVRAEDLPHDLRSRAASRTGSRIRTPSGTSGPPASGSRCGWRRCRPSHRRAHCGGRPTSGTSRARPSTVALARGGPAADACGCGSGRACAATAAAGRRRTRCRPRRGRTASIELSRRASLVSGDEILWSPEHPNLIDADAGAPATTGPVVDEVASYTAMRWCGAADGRFLLNGQPYFLRLVLDQGYWPESHLAAPGRRRCAARSSWSRSSASTASGCTRRSRTRASSTGATGWGCWSGREMPAAYEFSTRTVHRLRREWIEVLERDHSHPCIIAWVPINESWGVPALPTSRQPAAHLVLGALPPDQGAGPDPPGGRQRRVGARRHRHHHGARLHADGSELRERYGTKEAVAPDTWPGATGLPHHPRCRAAAGPASR